MLVNVTWNTRQTRAIYLPNNLPTSQPMSEKKTSSYKFKTILQQVIKTHENACRISCTGPPPYVFPTVAVDADLCVGCGHLGRPGPRTGTGIGTGKCCQVPGLVPEFTTSVT